MSTLSGIRNDQPAIDLIDGVFISVCSEQLGDLRVVVLDSELLKQRLSATYPTMKSGVTPVWATLSSRADVTELA